ncbi:MAG TPA: hypothetical protein VLL76_01145, partial [Candidatus Omnitrophota bacterium]|nr:hypothetical protein [Candidatus Omnitrophota bacterium]
MVKPSDIESAERSVWTLFAMLLALSLAALGYGAWSDFRAEAQAAQLQASEMARVVADRTGAELRTAIEGLARIEAVIAGRPGRAVAHKAQLLAVLRSVPAGWSIAVADASGRTTFLSIDEKASLDLSVRDFFRRHAAGEEVVIGPMLKDRVRGEPIVTVSRRLDGPDGSFRGVVAMALRPGDLTQPVLDVGDDSVVAVLMPDGTFVMRN